jgi:hypothetical protein
MVLGSTQPLTEMSTRNLLGDKGRPARKADLTAICEPCGCLHVSQPYGLPHSVTGIALPPFTGIALAFFFAFYKYHGGYVVILLRCVKLVPCHLEIGASLICGQRGRSLEGECSWKLNKQTRKPGSMDVGLTTLHRRTLCVTKFVQRPRNWTAFKRTI